MGTNKRTINFLLDLIADYKNSENEEIRLLERQLNLLSGENQNLKYQVNALMQKIVALENPPLETTTKPEE